jgi:DNA-binding Lrp family transcriptional regulator
VRAGNGKAGGDKPVPFAKVPHAIMSDRRLRPSARLLVPAVLRYAFNKPVCLASNKTLAEYLGVPVATVRRDLDALETCGHIRRETVKPHKKNMTGRVIHLRWVEAPEYLEDARTDPPDLSRGAAHSPEQGGCAQPRAGGLRTAVSNKEDVIVKKSSKNSSRPDPDPENRPPERQRPGGPEPGPEPPPDAPRLALPAPAEPTPPPAVTPASAVELAPAPLPTPPPPAPAAPQERTPGQLEFLASLTLDHRARWEAMPETKQAQLMEMVARGMDRVAHEEIARSWVVVPEPALPETTQELILALSRPEAPHDWTCKAVEAVIYDFGNNRNDRQLWRGFEQVFTAVRNHRFPAEDAVDCYRQAMGPKAKNRGAVFNTALQRRGWQWGGAA